MGFLEGWSPSNHFLERALEMCLTPEEIVSCMEDPEIIRPAGYEYPEDCRTYVRDRIAIPVNVVERRLITVIWRGAHDRDLESDLKRIRDKDVPPQE